ncbi:hypothetical protein PoB_002157300 [Plakobranchus ocellatus]|uniref:Uncharacterized protein n=1 Tax=Plakobranchus ocellatus TaxID=259542 RepID=A0AAV3ZKH2_9GAST|nr:hypothetical protein PoB_002157300 [Plakobranchus ocellatus]
MNRLVEKCGSFFHYMTVILLVCDRYAVALDAFDVYKIPQDAALVAFDVVPSHTNDDILPTALDVNFECLEKQMHLTLKYYPERRNDIVQKGGNNGDEYYIGDGIPVYTRPTSGQKENRGRSEVVFDTFPRLFVHNCRAFRDYKHQAAMVGIQDPRFNSFKFFGTFSVDGTQFFVQPFASDHHGGSFVDNSTNKRYHIIEKAPRLDFSADSGSISMVQNNVQQLQAVQNLPRNVILDKKPGSDRAHSIPDSQMPRQTGKG